jgi:hypothetical protein
MQTKSQKTDEYFQLSHIFGRKRAEGRVSRTAACSQLGDMKITIYDAKDFFRNLFRNLFRSRYSAIIYRKFYRKSLYLSEIYRKFILVPIFTVLISFLVSSSPKAGR